MREACMHIDPNMLLIDTYNYIPQLYYELLYKGAQK